MTDSELLEIMNRICKHQLNYRLHPLTCGNDSDHHLLFPIMIDRKIILRCLDCDYRQDYIPPMFMEEKP